MSKAWNIAHPEQMKEYRNTWKHKNYERVKKDRAAWMAKHKTVYKEMFPEKLKARQQLNDALAAGKVIKLPCEACGNTKSEAHHSDYSKPLSVTWLCRTCHREVHKDEN